MDNSSKLINFSDKLSEREDSVIKGQLTQEFILDDWIIDKCDRYYLLKWTGPYFTGTYYQKSGRIIREEITYQIILDGEERDILHAEKVSISFRRLTGQKEGYAIVRRIS